MLRRYDMEHGVVAISLGGDTLITGDADAALEEVKAGSGSPRGPV